MTVTSDVNLWHRQRILPRVLGWWLHLLFPVALSGVAAGQATATNQLLPGIAFISETRAEPPNRLFVAVIDLQQSGLQLRVAPGGPDPDGDGPWQTTLMRPTEIAAREGFDLVINGDFYRVPAADDPVRTNTAARGATWSAVSGPAASAGKTWSASSQRKPCLVIRRDGRVAITLLTQPAPDHREVLAGNTLLVRDGVAVPHENKLRHPRTAVGLNADATRMVILVVDGRKIGLAAGMNYDEVAAEMMRFGCHTALNLDGGGSSLMAARDPAGPSYQILNFPTDGRERAVANVLGVSVPRPPQPTSPPRQEPKVPFSRD